MLKKQTKSWGPVVTAVLGHPGCRAFVEQEADEVCGPSLGPGVHLSPTCTGSYRF